MRPILDYLTQSHWHCSGRIQESPNMTDQPCHGRLQCSSHKLIEYPWDMPHNLSRYTQPCDMIKTIHIQIECGDCLIVPNAQLTSSPSIELHWTTMRHSLMALLSILVGLHLIGMKSRMSLNCPDICSSAWRKIWRERCGGTGGGGVPDLVHFLSIFSLT